MIKTRNILIQTDTTFAISQIVAIQILLEKENKKNELQQIIDNEEVRVKNYFRELLYLGTLYSSSGTHKSGCFTK
jgi:dTDP-4-amino-4,6-dideoxygalactose transaminase